MVPQPPQALPKKPVGRSEHIEDLSSYEFGAGGQEILKNERLMKDETEEKVRRRFGSETASTSCSCLALKMGGFTYFLASAAALSGFL